MARFDFENLQPWDVSTDTLLPVGNHVCTIESAEPSSSKNGYPQIELEVDGGEKKGKRKDWIVYAEENGARKVVALFKAAGLSVPAADDQGEDGKLKGDCVARLVGKKVGVIVRDEESYKEPGKMVPRIKGYVDPSVIGTTSEPVAPATESTTASAGGVRDQDIPF